MGRHPSTVAPSAQGCAYSRPSIRSSFLPLPSPTPAPHSAESPKHGLSNLTGRIVNPFAYPEMRTRPLSRISRLGRLMLLFLLPPYLSSATITDTTSRYPGNAVSLLLSPSPADIDSDMTMKERGLLSQYTSHMSSPSRSQVRLRWVFALAVMAAPFFMWSLWSLEVVRSEVCYLGPQCFCSWETSNGLSRFQYIRMLQLQLIQVRQDPWTKLSLECADEV